MSYLTPTEAPLSHGFTMQYPGSRWIRREVTHNPWIRGAVGLCMILLVAAVHWPRLVRLLAPTNPGVVGWVLAVALSLVPLFVGQLSLLRYSSTAAVERLHNRCC